MLTQGNGELPTRIRSEPTMRIIGSAEQPRRPHGKRQKNGERMVRMPNVVTIREAVQRAKGEGLPVSEYSLRAWVKTGAIPVRKVGQKALLFYPHLVRYLQCEDGGDNIPAATETHGIRRVEQ